MKRVLLVDDDGAIRRIMRHHLVKHGFEVAEAPDGETAIARATAGGVDLIVLDIRMPGMDGYEVVDRLGEVSVTARIPILVCSVVADEARQRIVRARSFLLRPFGVNDFVAAVLAALPQQDAP